MNVKETILEEVIKLFQKDGIDSNSEAAIRQKLDISQATYNELFTDKEDLVRKAIIHDIEKQRLYQEKLLKNSPTSVDEMLTLIQEGVKNMKETNPTYISNLMQNYPSVWAMCLEHMNTHSYHQLYDILNRGIQAGDFRKDINMQLVTKIMLEMVGLLLNPQTFPADKFNMAEVYRSIYLYYVRGLCTDAGAKAADNYFSKITV